MISNYDIPKLQELLDNFYILTNIRIVVLDDQFKEISGSSDRHSEFCRIIRLDPLIKAKCLRSDQFGCVACKSKNKLHSYYCHAGLMEIVAPIRHENLIIGYMMFGQILPTANKDDYWTVVEEKCRNYSIPIDQLKTAYFKKQFIDEKSIHAASQIMEACAAYLYLSRAVLLSEDSLPQRIDKYIGNHFGDNLSVECLCQRFDISKAQLYKISYHCYGRGIQEEIRSLRITKAKELLATTNLYINEISESVGIADYNYFTKVFKNAVGMTPKDFRLQVGNKVD